MDFPTTKSRGQKCRQSTIWNSNLEASSWTTASFIFHIVPGWLGKPVTSSVNFLWGRRYGSGLWLKKLEHLQEGTFPGISGLSEESREESWHSQKFKGKVFVLTIVRLEPDEPDEKQQKAQHGFMSWMPVRIMAVGLRKGQLGARGDPSWPRTFQETVHRESRVERMGEVCWMWAVLAPKSVQEASNWFDAALSLKENRITSKRQGWRNS